jgi:hypothetical protein
MNTTQPVGYHRFPHKAKILVAVVFVLAVVVGLVTRAIAHTPTVKPGCSGLTVEAVNYPAESHVTVVIDEATRADQEFVGAYKPPVFGWSQTSLHSWHVVITSPDHVGEVNQSGTQVPCQPPGTTVTTPTTAVVKIPSYCVPGTNPPAPTGCVPPPPYVCGPNQVPSSVPCETVPPSSVPDTTPTTLALGICPPEAPVQLEDGSCVGTDYGAPPVTEAPTPEAPTTAPATPTSLYLPPTGPGQATSDTLPTLAVAAAALGAILVLATRRRGVDGG